MACAAAYDETSVLAGCRAGDEEAWRALVARHQDMVYAVCRRIAGPAAEDAAQETFVRVFHKLHTFRGGSKFSSWLYRVAYNCACDVARGRAGKAPTLELDEARERAGGDGADAAAANAEYAGFARAALARVKPAYRRVLELYYLMGKSYEEAAAVTGLPLGT